MSIDTATTPAAYATLLPTPQAVHAYCQALAVTQTGVEDPARTVRRARLLASCLDEATAHGAPLPAALGWLALMDPTNTEHLVAFTVWQDIDSLPVTLGATSGPFAALLWAARITTAEALPHPASTMPWVEDLVLLAAMAGYAVPQPYRDLLIAARPVHRVRRADRRLLTATVTPAPVRS